MESDEIVRAKAFVVPRVKKDLSSKEVNLYLSKQDLERRAFAPHLTQEQYIKLGYHNYN